MKFLKGEVIGVKSAKTVTVLVTRPWRHPVYHKTMMRKKKYQVDNTLKVKVGDQVLIKACRPMSKMKKWQVVKKIKKS